MLESASFARARQSSNEVSTTAATLFSQLQMKNVETDEAMISAQENCMSSALG